MTTLVKFRSNELKKLCESHKTGCVFEKDVSLSMPLQPHCLGNIEECLKNLLDRSITKFVKELNGMLLGYKNLRLLQKIGTIKDDNAAIYFQVQADYFIFRPYVGATLKGVVNKKSSTHLGILVHRYFHVLIPRPIEEPENKWIGSRVKEGQEVVFQVVVLDFFGALAFIQGELDERWLKQSSEVGDELVNSKAQMNISYVNFDKLKPNVSHSSSKVLSSISLRGDATASKQPKNNQSQANPKTRGIESDVSVIDKNITKKQKMTEDFKLLEFTELLKLCSQGNSCVLEKKVTQSLALQPRCLGKIKESLKNIVDSKVGKFDKELNGILLGYKNLRLLQKIGTIRNDNAEIYFPVQADYFIFRPYVGATLKGVVNMKSSTHLGILVHRYFNVVIPRPREEPENKWIGTRVQEGQEVVFRVVLLDFFGALAFIQGELDGRWLVSLWNQKPNTFILESFIL